MKRLKNLHHKYSANFIKYLLVGVLFTLLNIFMMWVAIDVWKFSTVVASTVIVVLLFFGKFYAYLALKMIHNSLLKYCLASGVLALVNIFLMWLFVDILGMSAALSATIITNLLFVLRFLAFDLFKLLKHKDVS